MRLILLSFLSLMLNYGGYAQWEVRSIPYELKVYADAVIRRYATDVKVLENDQVDVAEDIVVTVLNEKAIGQLFFKLIVRPAEVVNNFNVKIFDFEGKRIKLKRTEFDNSEIKSVIDGFSYFKEIPGLSCPFTVEIEYKKTLMGISELNVWTPANNPFVNIQNANLRVSCADTIQIRIEPKNVLLQSNSKDEEGYLVRLWEVADYIIRGKESKLVLNQSAFPYVAFYKK